MVKSFSFTLASLILLSACGKHTVDAEFQPYLDSFYDEAAQRNLQLEKNKISIQFGDTGTGVAAHCVLSNSRPGTGGDEIVVSRTAWDAYSHYYNSEREVVIFHELGHCLLGLDHEQTTQDICDETDESRVSWFKSAPVSIMKSDAFVEPRLYAHLRDYYLDELFHPTVEFPFAHKPSRQMRFESVQSQCAAAATPSPSPTDTPPPVNAADDFQRN